MAVNLSVDRYIACVCDRVTANDPIMAEFSEQQELPMSLIDYTLKCMALSGAFIISGAAWSADIAVIIDDSSGMCGYIAAPLAQNPYKQALMKLQEAKNAGGLSMEVYYLSNVRKPLSSGQVFDTIIAATAQTCPFKATSSPLHMAMDSQVIKAPSVILVTDLLFDGGAAGSSDSRAKFIDQFDALSKKAQRSARDWFNVSAGMMGIKSTFNGAYYPTSGQQKVDLGVKPLERPFYMVWKSSTGQFWPFLNQMTLIWRTPNWAGKKWSYEGAFAARFLPTAALMKPNDSFFMPPIRPVFSKNAQGQYPAVLPPSVFYGKSAGKLLDPVFALPKVVDAETANPNECFVGGATPAELQFTMSCGKEGAREEAFFASDQAINSVIFAFPTLDHTDGIDRSMIITPVAGGYSNKAEMSYRDVVASSDALRQSKGIDQARGGVVLKIGSLRGAKSIFANGAVGNNTLSYQVTERYQVQPADQVSTLMTKINPLWSADLEPCAGINAACSQANVATYQLSSLVNSMNVRLAANQHTVDLLNRASASQMATLRMTPAR
jgi:hypothetical protein